MELPLFDLTACPIWCLRRYRDSRGFILEKSTNFGSTKRRCGGEVRRYRVAPHQQEGRCRNERGSCSSLLSRAVAFSGVCGTRALP